MATGLPEITQYASIGDGADALDDPIKVALLFDETGQILVRLIHAQPNGPATVIAPSDDEIDAGQKKLSACVDAWKTSPALALVHPHLAVAGMVQDVTYDREGFKIGLSIQEILIAPPELDGTLLKVGCVWNQPYLMFDSQICTF